MFAPAAESMSFERKTTCIERRPSRSSHWTSWRQGQSRISSSVTGFQVIAIARRLTGASVSLRTM